jgi:hypothetical protein
MLLYKVEWPVRDFNPIRTYFAEKPWLDPQDARSLIEHLRPSVLRGGFKLRAKLRSWIVLGNVLLTGSPMFSLLLNSSGRLTLLPELVNVGTAGPGTGF